MEEREKKRERERERVSKRGGALLARAVICCTHLLLALVVLYASVDEQVEAIVEMRGAVVVAEQEKTASGALSSGVGHDEEVVLDDGPRWDDAWGGGIHPSVRRHRDPRPAIERSVIVRLRYHGEDKVPCDDVAAAHAIVEIDPSARTLVHHVVANRVVARRGLVITADLLAIDPDVVHVVQLDEVVAWVEPVHVVRRVDEVDDAARRDAVVADFDELVVADRYVLRVAVHEDCVASEGVKNAGLNRDARRVGDVERTAVVDRPVPRTRRHVRLVERGCGADEANPHDCDVRCGISDARAADAEERVELGGDEGAGRSVAAGGHVVQRVSRGVEVPLLLHVELVFLNVAD